MPLLNCTARTCVYNKEEYCSKGDIVVDGSNAKVADETCCSSFVERSGSAMNSVGGECGCKTAKPASVHLTIRRNAVQIKLQLQVQVPVIVMKQNAEALS